MNGGDAVRHHARCPPSGAVRRIMGKASNQEEEAAARYRGVAGGPRRPANPGAAGPGRTETQQYVRSEEGAPGGGQPLLVARGRAGSRGGAELGGGFGWRPLLRRLADEEVCRGSAARDGGDTFGGGLRR